MPHSFRRLFALEMLRAGVDIYSLQLLMGHSIFRLLQKISKADKWRSENMHTRKAALWIRSDNIILNEAFL